MLYFFCRKLSFLGNSRFFVNDDHFAGSEIVGFLTILAALFCVQDAALFV